MGAMGVTGATATGGAYGSGYGYTGAGYQYQVGPTIHHQPRRPA